MQATTATDSDTLRQIVILGGSYGGISIAHHLLKHTLPALKTHGKYRVVLISASSEILCRPACPRAMISDDMFDQSKLFVGIERAFARYGKNDFAFFRGTATAVDHEARTVSVEAMGAGQEIVHFHALVVATGASTASPLLSLRVDAKDLRLAWKEFRGALESAKSIVVAGGGPAGIETAAELGEYLHGRAKITVVTAGKQILPVLRPQLAAKAEKMLVSVGVDIIKGVRVEKVDPQGVGTIEALTSHARVSLSNGEVLEANLYIPATGTKPNSSFIGPSLLTTDGRVNTDTDTLRVSAVGPRVYAIGDVSSAGRPAVHNILDAVPVLSRTMKDDLVACAQGRKRGTADPNGKVFTPDEGETQLVPIGRRGGVGAMKGWRLPSWAVWLIKGRDYWLWTTPRLWSGRQW